MTLKFSEMEVNAEGALLEAGAPQLLHIRVLRAFCDAKRNSNT